MNARAGHRYNPLSIGLHWLTLLLLIAVYALMELRGYAPRGSDLRRGMMNWHYMLGLTVWLLTFVRLVLRGIVRAPAIAPAPPAWQRHLAATMHLLLYVFLAAMPLLGWLTLSAKGHAIPFYGLDMPALLGENHDLGENLEEIHETIGTIGYYLIGLHALAALYHHYIVRDDALRRMLPGRGEP
ncbi:MAG: cytochrome b [Proteobacteria bacterium]|nr:cytochrome b [Pseudomonadota bacterium]